MLNEELCAPVHPEEWFQWVLDYVGWSLASIFGDILVQLGLKPGIFLHRDNNQRGSLCSYGLAP